ncbi:MBL fold metallo-hydrolase RNA specificity domain-containing protein [Inediibacterium massiliense]|uniref:MBL fold metallo-hydrolase RNA specificity domain-containing protein n=1 Tax=Inediibacterium massiliense TaxID=1658111 RepID=UPI0006B6513A|nr:MBL fold metallo-hydrolase [Inediibacterium massiliense]
MQIQFLGASKVVTGSNYLITTDKYKLLLDCGMFQGSKQLEKLNFENFQFNPAEIDFVILSHAHIDHSGRIPKLVNDGFKGKIFSTKATRDLCNIMLVDSGHIQESDANWENNKRKRAGLPFVKPLYTAEDALISLNYFSPVLYDQKIEINEDIALRFRDGGHILGSSIIELWITEKGKTAKIVFSGDLGIKNKPILKNPEYIEEADYLIIESTYGNKIHEKQETSIKRLIEIINETTLDGGTVIIPSFAVNRTQELVYELNKYYAHTKELEAFMRVPVYVDSPMAVSATQVYRENTDCFDEETKRQILNGEDPFNFENLYYVKSQEESMRLNTQPYPKVILSASGMCTAGRILHHLKHNLWKKKNSIVFVGYQAEGTLGRQLKEGAKKVKLLGEEVVVEAQVYSIEGFSGHADQNDLIDWIKGFKKLPKKVFIVHGEEESSQAFSDLIQEKFHIDTIIPNMGYVFEIKDNMLRSYSQEILEPIKKKENIIKELQEIYTVFDNLVYKTDLLIDEKMLKKDYDKLKNKLLELNQKLMDINMFLSK